VDFCSMAFRLNGHMLVKDAGTAFHILSLRNRKRHGNVGHISIGG
jgi:hypothetical protein